MMRAALTWNLTTAQQQGEDLSMGGAFAPGEHPSWLPLLGILSSIPQLQSPTGVLAIFQFELPPFLLEDSNEDRLRLISMLLVTQPEAGSLLITSQLARKTWASDVFSVTLLRASEVCVP